MNVVTHQVIQVEDCGGEGTRITFGRAGGRAEEPVSALAHYLLRGGSVQQSNTVTDTALGEQWGDGNASHGRASCQLVPPWPSRIATSPVHRVLSRHGPFPIACPAYALEADRIKICLAMPPARRVNCSESFAHPAFPNLSAIGSPRSRCSCAFSGPGQLRPRIVAHLALARSRQAYSTLPCSDRPMLSVRMGLRKAHAGATPHDRSRATALSFMRERNGSIVILLF